MSVDPQHVQWCKPPAVILSLCLHPLDPCTYIHVCLTYVRMHMRTHMRTYTRYILAHIHTNMRSLSLSLSHTHENVIEVLVGCCCGTGPHIPSTMKTLTYICLCLYQTIIHSPTNACLEFPHLCLYIQSYICPKMHALR